MKIRINRDKKLGDCSSWPIWTSKPNHFDWEYKEEEHCYIIEGEATIELETSPPVTISPGDYIIFPKGLKCHWTVHKFIRKHYTFKTD